MANNKNKEIESEFFLDQNNEDANEDEQDIEADKYESESSIDDEGNRRAQPDSFSSPQWPQSYKYKSSLPFLYPFVILIRYLTAISVSSVHETFF